jgi:hypothetical protein
VTSLELALKNNRPVASRGSSVNSQTSEPLRESFPSMVGSISSVATQFPSSYFLDIAAFRQTREVITLPFISVPQSLLSEFGSPHAMREMIDNHFDTTHVWLPIVWRRRLQQRMTRSTGQPDPGLAILVGGIKMLCEQPRDGTHPSQSLLYKAVKEYLFTLENWGYFSIDVMQAAVFVATYELGHGIYPAAYMSVGHCAQLGRAMGLHDRLNAPQPARLETSWGESEESRRTWCAVLILDRYVLLTCNPRAGLRRLGTGTERMQKIRQHRVRSQTIGGWSLC